jgi:hypothetical protein
MSELDLERLTRALETHDYRYAKTMPKWPHWYTLRKEWDDDDAFVWCVEQIREHGFTEKFGGRPFRAFALNGWKYWTTGSPIEITKLINRKPIVDAERPHNHVLELWEREA